MNTVVFDRSGLLAAAAAALIGAATAFSAQPPPLYSNDFATRTSSGTIGNGTFSLSYTNGSLINADAVNRYGGQDMQDGWVRTDVPNRLVNVLVKSTNGNPYVCFCAGITGQMEYAVQPIANSLSSGVLRVSCDMRPPRQWGNRSRNMAVYVGPDAFLTKTDAESAYQYCCPMPSIYGNSDSEFKFRTYDGNGSGGGSQSNGTATANTAHWYRFVLELALTSNKYTAAVYDMGTEQPTLATATPGTPVENFGGGRFGFRTNLTPALGGITTLGLSVSGPGGGSDGETDIDLTARFDNILLTYKPEGGSAFTEIYSNDFATRTYTRVGPGSTSYAYTVGGSDCGTQSYALTDLVPNEVLQYPNGTNGPVGQDGWTRRYFGAAKVRVSANPDPTNPNVCFWHDTGLEGSSAYAVQRLGNRLTNSTARFSVDMRPPNLWYLMTNKGMFVNVGDDAYYNGEMYDPDPTNNGFLHHYATRFGFNGTASNEIKFVIFNGDKANGAAQVYGAAATTNWYRFVADLDLTNGTVALNIYDMGPSQPTMATSTPGTPVQTFASNFRRIVGTGSANLVGGITSFGLTAFGVRGGWDGGNIQETALFDNVRVEARPTGSPAWTLIYANDFSSRTYTNLGEYAVATLVGRIDLLAGGQDDWMRRNNGSLSAHLSKAGCNAHFRASSSAPKDHTYAVQPLGTRVTGNILCCQADMRPPRYWTWANFHSIGVYLGDDEFWQGNRGATRSFSTRFAVKFGFDSASTEADRFGVYPDVSFLVADGNGAGASSNKLINGVVYTNWYRFKAEADLAANTYQVKVYNMGTAQPTLETPTPSSPVAVFENNRFTTDLWHTGDSDEKLDGISAIGLAAFGVRGGGLFPANETALVDNLCLWVKPKGTLIRIF